jgi:hypothetical protein
MSNFNSLNFKTLLCAAIATLPTVLVLSGLDNSVNQTVAQTEVRTQVAAAASLRLAQLSNIPGQTVLVD